MDAINLAGRRFGLVADTHDVLVDWADALARLRAAWGHLDAILHCGDLTSPAALETLAAIAPIYATRSDGDPPPAPPVLTDGPRLFAVGGVRVGLLFSLGKAPPDETTAARIFGAPIDVCVYGGTHESGIAEMGGVLFVNPGSPTLAATRTAATLTIENGRASAHIVEIR